MFKFAKFTLLILVAFLFLGLSITAIAGNPWLAGKEQQIVSAPYNAYAYACGAVNVSDTQLEVFIEVYDGEFGTVQGDLNKTLDPGLADGIASSAGGQLSYCKVTWEGKANDVRAAFCANKNSTGSIQVCLELY